MWMMSRAMLLKVMAWELLLLLLLLQQLLIFPAFFSKVPAHEGQKCVIRPQHRSGNTGSI